MPPAEKPAIDFGVPQGTVIGHIACPLCGNAKVAVRVARRSVWAPCREFHEPQGGPCGYAPNFGPGGSRYLVQLYLDRKIAPKEAPKNVRTDDKPAGNSGADTAAQDEPGRTDNRAGGGSDGGKSEGSDFFSDIFGD